MRSQRVKNRFHQALPTLWAAFACADVVTEAARRQLRRSGSPPAAEPAPTWATGQVFIILGRRLLHVLRRMLTADEHYQRLRDRQRRRQKQRDRIAKRAYSELTAARRFFRGLLGYENACRHLGLQGATAREPTTLYHQLDEVLDHLERRAAAAHGELAEADDSWAPKFSSCEAAVARWGERLGASRDELRRALDDVGLGKCEVVQAMLDQRAALADFDRTYKASAHNIEAQLILNGLPTLAAGVRPGVGRRGRPLKKRPVDLYPDLIEQVRSEGLMDLDAADVETVSAGSREHAASSNDAAGAPARDSTSPNGVRNGSPADWGATGAAPEALRHESKIDRPLHKLPGSEEKIAQDVDEQSEAGSKIDPSPHDLSVSDEKIELGAHELSVGESKIDPPLHKPPAPESSGLLAGLTLPPPIPDPGCRHGGDGRRGSYRPKKRSVRLAAGRSTAPKARKTAWWRRLLPAA